MSLSLFFKYMGSGRIEGDYTAAPILEVVNVVLGFAAANAFCSPDLLLSDASIMSEYS